jgi:CRISPR-associated protein Csm4
MKTYAVKIEPLTSFITPWQADTLFGHLCWTVAYADGDEALAEFLKPFKEGEPPFLLSDGFPGEMLPLPLSAGLIEESGVEPVKRFERAKALKQTEYVPLEIFNRILRGQPFDVPAREETAVSATTMHNTINRLTGTTPEEGGLYAHDELFPAEMKQPITFYAKTADGLDINRLRELLQMTAERGYGKRASVGKGAFRVLSVEPFDGFNPPADSNGFVSLSNFVPAASDPTDGYYRTLVKYGKLGAHLARSENPFKTPLLMLRAGSCFRASGCPREFYGGMVGGLSPSHPEVTHYAYAFSVPMKMPPEEKWSG